MGGRHGTLAGLLAHANCYEAGHAARREPSLVTAYLRRRMMSRLLSGGYARLEVIAYGVFLAACRAWLALVDAVECVTVTLSNAYRTAERATYVAHPAVTVNVRG